MLSNKPTAAAFVFVTLQADRQSFKHQFAFLQNKFARCWLEAPQDTRNPTYRRILIVFIFLKIGPRSSKSECMYRRRH